MKETIADVSSASPSSERMRGLWVNGVKKVTPFTHNPLIRSDEGLALETSAIVSFTAFHYPHQHTVDTPVCLRLCNPPTL